MNRQSDALRSVARDLDITTNSQPTLPAQSFRLCEVDVSGDGFGAEFADDVIETV